MPQSLQSSEPFDGFVTLSQLVSSPVAIADLDTLQPEQLKNSHQAAGPFSPKTSTWDSPNMSADNTYWEMGPQMNDVPDLTGSYHGSSASNSPSPRHESFISVQQEQHHKRRAQNRAAQRAYRDRKMRHLVDLESGIREIEDKIRRLQTENTGLIRELCEVRAENREWRETRSRANGGCRPTNIPASRSDHTRPSTLPQSTSSSDRNRQHGLSSDDKDALYEPFAAMWNLIRLDPSVVQGDVSAATVLERLRSRVEGASLLKSTSDDGKVSNQREALKGQG